MRCSSFYILPVICGIQRRYKMDKAQTICEEDLKEYRSSYQNNPISRVATRAASKSSVNDICYDTEHAKKMNHKFSVEVQTLPATNQKSSGRCWIFASLNILREKIAKDLNLADFELSQSFFSFYDHLEKANSFLEHILETAEKSTEDRYVDHLLSSPIGDGGWWEFFVGLCKKYGAVPKEAMPETKQSENSASMNMLLNMQLREDALVLRQEMADGKSLGEVRSHKKEMLSRVYNILAICLGNPPETFDFEYVNKDKEYHADRNLTPHTFYDKYIGRNIENIVSILNAPTPTKPFHKTYVISHEESVYGVTPVKSLNVTMEEFKAAVIRQLQAGDLVWFSCDCHPYGSREEGIWDTGLYDYETPFGMELHMDKGEMLEYHQSAPNHAMLLTGVNLVNGKPDKWKIQNSWGTDKADKGYFIMSDAWFDRYVYFASIDQKYLTEEQRTLYKQEPVVLPPWDVLA